MNFISSLSSSDYSGEKSFTLIELLLVIAILSILAVTVILTLNPSELLKQARDSTRLSDIAQINNALNLYQVDSPNGSFGNASTTYISIPDPSATSTTQGNQCSGLGLPSLPAGYSYHCSASSTYRNSDGTGWLPVNFQAMSYGSPLGVLPIDPVNNGSSTYYTYTPGGSWQLTATPESNKIRTTQANQSTGAITMGSDLTLSPLFNPNGLVGYWKFDEGTGTSAGDNSGNGNTGTLQNSPSWVSGKIGNALGFNGYTGASGRTYVGLVSNLNPSNFTIAAWVNVIQSTSYNYIYSNARDCCGVYKGIEFRISGSYLSGTVWNGANAAITSNNVFPFNSWHYIAFSYDGSTMKIFNDGVLDKAASSTIGVGSPPTYSNAIGGMGMSPGTYTMNGTIDDIRIYNRALSAAEIYALYSATR